MKKSILSLMILLMFSACSVLNRSGVNLQEKYAITKESAKEWDKTITKTMEGEALIPEWYGDGGNDENGNPIIFLRKTGRMSEKDFNFLLSLEKKTPDEITDAEFKKFLNLVNKYTNNLPRKFYLKDENLKNPKGLVDKMVSESYVKMDTPSSHIKNVVATNDEWEQIVVFSQQIDLSEKDTRKLRKLLNKFMKRKEFYDEKAWYNREISARVIAITNIDAKESKSSIEQNNVKAKALYIAYPEYFSTLDKWDD